MINEPFIDEHALVAAMPGLADAGRRALFLRELEHSVQLDAYRRSFVARRGPVEPLSEGWHPWAAIATLSTDHVDEAIWLAFLTTFFGPDERRPDAWRATRVVYSAFGAESLTYTRVRDDPDLVRRLCHANDALFRSLPRGNHRNEPKDPEHKQGLVNSVASLLTLAAAHGGLAQLL